MALKYGWPCYVCMAFLVFPLCISSAAAQGGAPPTGYSYSFKGADYLYNVSSQEVVGARVGPTNGNTMLPFPFRSSTYTVEVWVNPRFATRFRHDGIVNTILTYETYSSGYGFYYDPCGINWWVSAAETELDPNQLRFWIPRNAWSYVVGVFTDNLEQKVYLNGKLVLSKTRLADTSYILPNLLYFGRYLNEFEDYGFNGNLDGIRIWNRAWTDEEVAQNYETVTFYPPGTPYQLGAWDFETGSGLTVPDLTGNGWDATIFGPTASGDKRPPSYLPAVETAQAATSYWTPQNCSSYEVGYQWCVPSPFNISEAPQTSTTNYTLRPTKFDWMDPIINSHKLVTITGTSSPALQIGFNFTYFGTTYSQVYVDKNGVLLFFKQDPSCDSDPLYAPGMPYPNGLSVFWAQNTNIKSPIQIYYATKEESQFIVTWYQVTPTLFLDANLTFQVKLFSNGQIQFQYYQIDLPYPFSYGAYATIGLCQAVGWDVPITLANCNLYRSGASKPYITSKSALIVCPANENGTICAGISESNNGKNHGTGTTSLFSGILATLLVALVIVLLLLLLAILLHLFYARWKRKQIKFIADEGECISQLTTQYREIDWTELELLELLGAGAFGKVYKGKWRGAAVAVKVCTDLHLSLMTSNTLQSIRQEACLMELLGNHPNVISFVGAVTKGDYFALVTEYCPYGSMYDLFIAKKFELKQQVTRELLVRMLRDVARGILHLHSESVIHRDISARNMLVTNDLTVRVTDFGLSRLRQDSEASYATTKSNVGPVKWMAPEAITKRVYSEKSDSWSFGVLVWEVVTQSEPWHNVALLDIAIGVGRLGWKLSIPNNCDPLFARLMKNCWKQKPKKRPSFAEIEKMLSEELHDDDSLTALVSNPTDNLSLHKDLGSAETEFEMGVMGDPSNNGDTEQEKKKKKRKSKKEKGQEEFPPKADETDVLKQQSDHDPISINASMPYGDFSPVL